ncbi:TPA: glycosyltransferase [Klebsiella oxytoca]|nr:glycosyltransferase [Klebsiella oxytoca]HEJ8978005.1 glycosyltransferase [Klebsiella oxytoca]
MKKVLIACRAYYPDVAGGGEISTRLLAEKLSDAGYEVQVLAISDKPGTKFCNGVKINRLPYRNVYWSFKNKNVNFLKKILWHSLDANNFLISHDLTKIIKEIKPDVLITSTIEDVSSNVWKVAKKNGVRVMHVLRSYSLMCVNANMFKEDNCSKICSTCKPFSILKKKNSKYVDDVIGISEFVLEAHLKNGYFKNANSHVIYNMCLDEVLDVRNHNGLENGNIAIGYLGRIHKTKGIDLVIEAIGALSADYKKNITFKIAGSGDDNYVDELRSLAKESKLVCTFEGNIPANQLLDNIDVLIVPSKWNEPFGRVVIESLGRRVPVIGKRVGGIPELLKENPGFMFNTVDDLKDVITSYFNKDITFKFNLSRFENDAIINEWKKIIG